MAYFQERFRKIHRRALKHVHRLTRCLRAQNMRNELGTLVSTASDPAGKKAFAADMRTFSELLNRYVADGSQKLDWEKVNTPATDQIIPYDQLTPPTDEVTLLKQLAVLKVNGGLGTSMGMQGAKGALEVKNGLTFLDIAVQQIVNMNSNHGVNIPLLLMTSFNTHDDTLRIIQKYDKKEVRITPFIQSKYPRIMKDSLVPCATNGQDEKSDWYPPGHGDLYTVIYRSGMLDRLLKEGKQYLFVSNSDNLGAIVDPKILYHMVETKTDFLMEVTDKTRADIEACLHLPPFLLLAVTDMTLREGP
ncbi:hypothetical protein DXG01_013645 [Tephrocybe rancida]|nr:hypothetical protein DXG01_013645 [Tephrocybe rancida]